MILFQTYRLFDFTDTMYTYTFMQASNTKI